MKLILAAEKDGVYIYMKLNLDSEYKKKKTYFFIILVINKFPFHLHFRLKGASSFTFIRKGWRRF